MEVLYTKAGYGKSHKLVRESADGTPFAPRAGCGSRVYDAESFDEIDYAGKPEDITCDRCAQSLAPHNK